MFTVALLLAGAAMAWAVAVQVLAMRKIQTPPYTPGHVLRWRRRWMIPARLLLVAALGVLISGVVSRFVL